MVIFLNKRILLIPRIKFKFSIKQFSNCAFILLPQIRSTKNSNDFQEAYANINLVTFFVIKYIIKLYIFFK